MYCLKCGKEITEPQVFCETCQESMADYPIKADAKVTLPHRTVTEKALPRKRPPQPEELLQAMQRKLRRMRFALVLVSVLCALCVAALVYAHQTTEQIPTIGRNYQIDTTQQP